MRESETGSKDICGSCFEEIAYDGSNWEHQGAEGTFSLHYAVPRSRVKPAKVIELRERIEAMKLEIRKQWKYFVYCILLGLAFFVGIMVEHYHPEWVLYLWR